MLKTTTSRASGVSMHAIVVMIPAAPTTAILHRQTFCQLTSGVAGTMRACPRVLEPRSQQQGVLEVPVFRLPSHTHSLFPKT